MTIFRADYRRPVFLVSDVAIDFDLDPRATKVMARTIFDRQDPGDLFLNGTAPLVAIRLNGERVEAEAAPQGLWLRDLPDQFELEIETLVDPAANTEL